MAIWFVRTDGTNSIAGVANGRDALGLSLVNATYDHTGNGEGDRHLASTGAFSGYTHTTGDLIYLLNAAGGVADGLYTIDSKVDSDAILLVADSGLTADSTSDVDSSDGAFDTISYAIQEGATGNTAFADGDELRICNNASHISSATISFDTVGGVGGTPIFINGATANGLVDGTRATVDFSSTTGGAHGFEQDAALAAASVAIFKHLRITGANGANILVNEPNSQWVFYDCRIDHAVGSGILNNAGTGTTHHTYLIDCEIDTNGGSGFGLSNNNRWGPLAFGCVFHDNTGSGVEFGIASSDTQIVSDCIFYDNAIGIEVLDGNSSLPHIKITIKNCTVADNTGNGIDLGNTGWVSSVSVINTVITNNGGFGIDFNTLSADRVYLTNCWFYINSSGHFSDSYTVDDFSLAVNVTLDSDPLYTDRTTDGSEDYEPQASSELLGAGIPANTIGGTSIMDIGGVQRQQASGGGGTTIIRPTYTM